jgi:hypothetical protein
MLDYICNLHPHALSFCEAVSAGQWWVVTKYIFAAAAVALAYFAAKWLKDTKKWTTWLGARKNVKK